MKPAKAFFLGGVVTLSLTLGLTYTGFQLGQNWQHKPTYVNTAQIDEKESLPVIHN